MKRVLLFAVLASLLSVLYVELADGWYSISNHTLGGGFPLSYFEYTYLYISFVPLFINILFWTVIFAILMVAKNLFGILKAKMPRLHKGVVTTSIAVGAIFTQILYIFTRYDHSLEILSFAEANSMTILSFDASFYILYYLFIVSIFSLILVYLFSSTKDEVRKLLFKLVILHLVFLLIQLGIGSFSTITV